MTETPRSYSSLEPDTKYSGELKDGKKHGHGLLQKTELEGFGEWSDDELKI